MAHETSQQGSLTAGRVPVLGGISEEQRIRLIGELLCKGIICSPTLHPPVACVDGVSNTAAFAAEDRIVDYLRRHQPASPAEIRSVLNLSRTGAYRALRRLLSTGQVVSNGGLTSAAAYRLVDPSRN